MIRSRPFLRILLLLFSETSLACKEKKNSPDNRINNTAGIRSSEKKKKKIICFSLTLGVKSRRNKNIIIDVEVNYLLQFPHTCSLRHDNDFPPLICPHVIRCLPVAGKARYDFCPLVNFHSALFTMAYFVTTYQLQRMDSGGGVDSDQKEEEEEEEH